MLGKTFNFANGGRCVKNIFGMMLTCLFAFVMIGFRNDFATSKGKPKEDHAGLRGLSRERRINAEGRYSKLFRSFDSSHAERTELVSLDSYIEHGYFDAGFVPAQKHRRHGNIPDGFWVFVYPKWYVWQKQSLHFEHGA